MALLGEQNCTFAERVKLLEVGGRTREILHHFHDNAHFNSQLHDSIAVLGDHTVDVRFNSSGVEASSIPVAALFKSDARARLLAMKDKNFILYQPAEPDRMVDGSTILIFLMAVFTAGLGSLWSGYTKHQL